MSEKSSYSGYHSPKARYKRSRKKMNEKELKKHDDQVNLVLGLIAFITLLICIIIVALGGTPK